MPKWSSELLGQERAVRTVDGLLRGSAAGRFLLFSGPRGVGKSTAVRWLASALLCDSPSGEYCGDCLACRDPYSHPDVDAFIPERATLSIKVDEVRNAAPRAAYPPVQAQVRVWVLDPMDQLTDGAANALLRLLEEPPKKLWILGAADNLSRVAMTLRSRAYKVPFGALSAEVLGRLHPELPVEYRAAGTLERVSLLNDKRFREMREQWDRLLQQSIYDPQAPAEFAKRLRGYSGGVHGFFTALLVSRADLEIAEESGDSYNDGATLFAAVLDETQVLLQAIADLDANVNATLVCEDAVRRIRQIRKQANSS